MKKILLTIWQLPQIMLGLLLYIFCRIFSGKPTKEVYGYETIYMFPGFRGGISLGTFIFVSSDCTENTKKHERGHSIQSRMLGPFYLFVVGIPSFLRASVWTLRFLLFNRIDDYYKGYPEKWADKLGDVNRL